MSLRFTSIYLFLALMIVTTPAFSHTGHTSLFHSHSGIEYILALCVVAGIIYRYLKH